MIVTFDTPSRLINHVILNACVRVYLTVFYVRACVRVRDMCELLESKKRGREIRGVIDWCDEENVHTHVCQEREKRGRGKGVVPVTLCNSRVRAVQHACT